MNDTKQPTRAWHKGPPPFPGWWNASKFRDEEMWRWWDGRAWSYAADEKFSRPDVGAAARFPYPIQNDIEWTDYWPENARVPRVDPRSKT